MKYLSQCSCGIIDIELSLPKRLEEYEPRACDCDFCVARSVSYVSDPDGLLTILHTDKLERLKQGSKQASFWQCSSCKDLIAVTCQFEKQTKGAINAGILKKHYKLKMSTTASPKLLPPEEKRKRWDSIWLKVELNK